MTDNTSGDLAGGIGNFGGTLYVQRAVVRHNTAPNDGGGIGNFGALAVVDDSKVNENTTQGLGGGVANDTADIVLRRTEINKNRAIGPDSQGGGIANFTTDAVDPPGIVSLTKSRVIENFATNPPGGVFSENNEVAVDDDSVIIKNRPTNCKGNPPGVVIPNCFG
ncbi:hypothetical protein [Actinopolymorpha pittospori]